MLEERSLKRMRDRIESAQMQQAMGELHDMPMAITMWMERYAMDVAALLTEREALMKHNAVLRTCLAGAVMAVEEST
jgi:hypothetical protein